MSGRLIILMVCYWVSQLAIASELPKQLKLAVDKGWAPYVYLDEEQSICGTDATLLLTVLEQMGIAVRRVDIPSQRLKIKINNGEVDIVIGAAKNKERQRKNYFSESYRSEKISYAYLKSAYIQLNDPIEILLDTGSVVAVNLAGWFGEPFEALKAQYRGQLVHVEEHRRALKMLKLNRLHAMVGDRFSLMVMIEDVAKGEMQVSNTIIHEQPVYFMFSRQKVDQQFMATFDSYLMQNLGETLSDRCSEFSIPIKRS